ncbi:hypothetical protein [Lentibacillus juripiscarius]|uniref:Uncharacterized protein n=1 Tax=Lentibacillus juripiscarius TaxID=257446 RepID=A0ABW5V8I9_9BACI
MFAYYYNPEVNYLLIDRAEGKTEMLYDENPSTWSVPIIGPRPPYYTHPRYEPYYPVI